MSKLQIPREYYGFKNVLNKNNLIFSPIDYFDELIYNTIPCKCIRFISEETEGERGTKRSSVLPEPTFDVIVSSSYRAID